jgi:hypothetical protein
MQCWAHPGLILADSCVQDSWHFVREANTTAQPGAIPAQEPGVGGVRAFTRADIPAVVALRRQLFRTSERGSVRELEAYLEELFFTGPVADDTLASLVYEDESGAVCGFLGVVPRRMLFDGRSLRVAVATQLMVASHCRALAARKIARVLINGPQDLTLSDAANGSAKSIWASVGGRAALAYSMTWTLPLRPARYVATLGPRTTAVRALAFAARPLLALTDAMLLARRTRPRKGKLHETTTEQFDTERHIAELSEILERWALRPRYSTDSFSWMLDHVVAKRRFGVLQGVVVRDRRRMLGWFLYCLNPGGVSTVVQFGAVKGCTECVLGRMTDHARRRGVVALTGRYDPSTAQELSDAGASFRREGPWLLYHSRHPGVEGAIETGGAFLSRLEGEWWMSF